MQLCPLTERDWPSLHKLMLQRKFPHVPTIYCEAKPHFARAKAFGLKPSLGLEAAFLFGPPEDGIAFFDVVCSVGQEGRWAMPSVLRALYAQAFLPPPNGLGLRAVWVQTHSARALKAALKAGFVAVTPLGKTEAPILVLTARQIPPSLKPQQQEM